MINMVDEVLSWVCSRMGLKYARRLHKGATRMERQQQVASYIGFLLVVATIWIGISAWIMWGGEGKKHVYFGHEVLTAGTYHALLLISVLVFLYIAFGVFLYWTIYQRWKLGRFRDRLRREAMNRMGDRSEI